MTKEENAAAQGCYRSAGYRLREYYETLYLEQKSDELSN
jgi:ribosomal protein S18 acetylase RimI-like enzyme